MRPEDARVEEVSSASFLSHFTPDARRQLMSDARRVSVEPGMTLFLGAEAPQPGLVIDGSLRVFVSSPDGREATIQYVRAADSIGLVALVGGPPSVNIQALTRTDLIVFDAALLRELVLEDADAAWGISEELARVVNRITNQFGVNVFGTIRQRLISHLLLLATAHTGEGLLVRAVSHADIGNAVGTAREVVSRTLRELARAGLIETSKGTILLRDPELLLIEVEQAHS